MWEQDITLTFGP